MNHRSALAFATFALVGGALVSGLFVGGCSDDGASTWLAEARAAHTLADAASEPRVAEAALAEAFARPVPAGVTAEDARVVRQDLAYRAASIALADERPEDARRHADRGLALGAATDIFTANLYVVRGQAREALGDAIGAASDYHEALLVNERLLDRLLDDPAEEEQ